MRSTAERVVRTRCCSDKRLGVFVLRVEKDILHMTRFHAFAAANDNHIVTNLTRYSQIVRDKENADAELHLNFFQELQDIGLHRNVERGNGFVANQNFRLTGECAGDRNALTLTAGELIRITIECVGRQANNLHKFLRASKLLPWEPQS